jgi:hypothetical protein
LRLHRSVESEVSLREESARHTLVPKKLHRGRHFFICALSDLLRVYKFAMYKDVPVPTLFFQSPYLPVDIVPSFLWDVLPILSLSLG